MQKLDKSYRKSIHRIVHNYIPDNVIKKRNKEKSWDYGYHPIEDMVVISKDGTIGQVIEINDLLIALPSQYINIRNELVKAQNQKWERYEVPTDLKDFDTLYNEDSASYEQALEDIYNIHEDFIINDYKRISDGDWIYIDGEAVYIPGGYYFFLQHYLLVSEKYPDYREPQRDYFIWLEACYADNRCLGSLFLKSRRFSFSTSAGSELLRDAIITVNGFYPIVSKKDDDASTLFSQHIVRPLIKLPKHLQPKRSGEANPKKELYFGTVQRKMTVNNKGVNSDTGLNTKIKPYATTVDAYDGTQVTKSINDEIGKMKGNLDINEYWDQAHKMCHIIGSRVVGKAICGSTANPPNKGGKNYEIFYNNSKLSTRDKTGKTLTGLYAIFIAADYSLMGFFDEYGYVIYHDPKEPIKNELGEIVAIGSKTYLDAQENSCGDDIQKLNSQKRNNPRVDTDAFLDEDASSMYGTPGVIDRIHVIRDFKKTEAYKEQYFNFNLVWRNGIKDTEVDIVRCDEGRFTACWLPPVSERNKFKLVNGRKEPVNSHYGSWSCDPYQVSKVVFGKGSKQALGLLTKEGNEGVPDNTLAVYYNYRPESVDTAEEDVIKAIVFFSIPILVEINKDSLVKKLYDRGYRGYSLENPLKKRSELSDTEKKYGGIHAVEKNIKEMETFLETYLVNNLTIDIDEKDLKIGILEVLESLTTYSTDTRKKHDIVAMLQMAVIANSKLNKKKEIPKQTHYEDIYGYFKVG
ncbi:hypothetical protein M2T28_14255 [Elizabethkingia miricola]|uniref:hypothetical protein n=1 Tax=Elizabethkingia TaxID=308865 RepID=UPI0010C20960|nr:MULTISPECIES: hypothetical protein [Elizabethkingia]MCL1653783.1 hypothetical protein [Elizabethkingia miricola]QCO45767.1 hypothetical protein FCS00_05055 [Elizabethkingia sp. 2-6]WQM37680.1 hypothetical protein U2S95_15075 [Elizabethkingia miricola]DAN07581.1 MAG TPA: DNA packaging protein [Crassvirales sp.]